MADFNISFSASELNAAINKANSAAPQSTTYTKAEVDTALVELEKRLIRPVVYGWHIDSTESDPSACVTYLADAVGMTPAAMGSRSFSYGSWKNAFFMPKPCAVKYDGTVDYYLDPDDYTLKSDGTASGIADPDYPGNFMMEWPKIWYKFEQPSGEPAGNGVFYCSTVKIDESYHCWCNINSKNQETDHFYTAIYNGTGTTKLRSISGVALTSENGNGNTTGQQEIDRALANNVTSDVAWYTDVYSDRLLINSLLVLMSKSLDTQGKFGRGLDSGGQTEKEAYVTGLLNDKGLFWGSTSAGTFGVKVFGMENWWGCVWNRIAGCIMTAYNVKVKLTYGTADGTTVTGYNSSGDGYISLGAAPSANGYVSKMLYSDKGYMPLEVSGSTSTYYCDYLYGSSTTLYLLAGGGSGAGARAGAFYFNLSSAFSRSDWTVSAAISLKPLV